MARLPRLVAPGFPHHVIQRGNNRQPTFLDDGDFSFFLELLAEQAAREKVAIHGYVLMDNHFHLLATPETVEGLPKMMQAVGRRYVQRFNKRHQRSGSLWEGRYRATPVQTETYLLACLVYLDLNPVRAGMLSRAVDYRWSSHRHYVGLRHDRLITPHGLMWSLGNTPFEREAAYAALVNQGLTAKQQSELTDTARRGGWALGESDFVSSLQKSTGRRVTKLLAGRPVAAKP